MTVRTDSRTSKHVARAVNAFLVKCGALDPLEFKAAIDVLQNQLFDEIRPEPLQKEIRRRCAEMYLQQCIVHGAELPSVLAAFDLLESLGYSNVERRSHFAALLINYSATKSNAVEPARLRAATALRRIRLLRKSSYLRKYMEPKLSGFLNGSAT